MTDKNALLFFSGGKDSLMAYDQLINEGYTVSLLTIDVTGPSSRQQHNLTSAMKHKRFDSVGLITVPYTNTETYASVLKSTLCVLPNTNNTVIVTGEHDHFTEVVDFFHICRSAGYKGLYLPYLSMKKEDYMDKLGQLSNTLFVVVSAWAGNTEAVGLVGHTLTPLDLHYMYYHNPGAFFNIQTLAVKSSLGDAISDEEILSFCNNIKECFDPAAGMKQVGNG